MSLKRGWKRFTSLFQNRDQLPLQNYHQSLEQIQLHLSSNLYALERIHALEWCQHLSSLQAISMGDNPLLRFGQRVFSQNDEDGIIEAIWQRIAPERTGTFIEFGVGDGTENNTLNLLVKGWRGAWFGGEDLKFEPVGDHLHFQKCWIDRENIVALTQTALKAMDVMQPDLLSLDLDGNDWHFAKAILESGVAPKVFVFEYNATFTPATHWIMPYNSAHKWDGTSYFGASLRAFCSLLEAHGYRLVCCNANGVNAFFVRKDQADNFQDIPLNPAKLFMPPRFTTRLFPYGGHPITLRLLETMISGSPESQ